MGDTERLIRCVAKGDDSAINRLLEANRDRLTRFIKTRMDARVSARFDPSDVVQDTLMQAHVRLDEYLAQAEVPFYVWLRFLAWQRLTQLYRQHLGAEKRSVTREEHRHSSDEVSQRMFVERLAANMTGPVAHAVREETRRRVRGALQLLRPHDREILELRYLEQLNTQKIAHLLNISEGAVSTRHFRAIQRLQELVEYSEDVNGDF